MHDEGMRMSTKIALRLPAMTRLPRNAGTACLSPAAVGAHDGR